MNAAIRCRSRGVNLSSMSIIPGGTGRVCGTLAVLCFFLHRPPHKACQAFLATPAAGNPTSGTYCHCFITQSTESRLYQEQSLLAVEHTHCHQMLMFVQHLVKANKQSTVPLRSAPCQDAVIAACVSKWTKHGSIRAHLPCDRSVFTPIMPC